MEYISILLITDDFDYANALVTGMAFENNGIMFFAADNKNYKHYTEGTYDLILSDHPLDKSVDYILLTEKKEEVDKGVEQQSVEEDVFSRIYKYDTAENICNEILYFYVQKTGKPLRRKWTGGECSILYFCSSTGGTGKTSIALGLAQELTRYHGKQVLYISLEEFESTGLYFEKQEAGTIDDYLYHMDRGKEISGLLQKYVQKDKFGVFSFSASKGRNPLKLLSRDELLAFFEHIVMQKSFDYILVDGDCCADDNTLAIMLLCHKICIVNRGDNTSGDREQRFSAYLEHALGKQVNDKIIEIKNFMSPYQDTEGAEDYPKLKEQIYIDTDTYCCGKEHWGSSFLYAINIERDFGTCIKRFSEKLTLN